MPRKLLQCNDGRMATKRAARKPPPPQPTENGTNAEGDSRRAFVVLTTPLKADRRSYNSAVVSQWTRALTLSITIQNAKPKRAARKPPSRSSIDRRGLSRSGDLKQRLQDRRSLL